MKEALKTEIKWAKTHKGDSGKGKAFEAGFIKGLRQAMFLLRAKERQQKEADRIAKLKAKRA